MKRICKQCGAEFILTQDEISFYQSKNLHIPKRCEKCRMENRSGGKAGTGMRPVSSGERLMGSDYESAKMPGQVVRAYNVGRNDKKRIWITVAIVLLLLAVGVVGFRATLLPRQNGALAEVQPVEAVVADVQTTAAIEDDANGQEIVDEQIGEISAEQPSVADIQPEVSADEVFETDPKGDEATEQATVSEVEQTPVFVYSFRKAQYLQEHFERHGAEFGYASAEEYLAGANRVVASPEALHKLEAEDGDDVYYLESTNEFVIVSTDGYLRTYFKPDDGKEYFDRQ